MDKLQQQAKSSFYALWSNIKMIMENKKTKRYLGDISCKYARELIEKRKTQELEPHERNTLFGHSSICKECREIDLKKLNKLIGDVSLEDLKKEEK